MSDAPPGSGRLRLGALLGDLALQPARLRREFLGVGLREERIKAAAVVHALQRVRRDAQLDRTAERVRDQRDAQEVRQEAALGLDVRVADLVAHLGAFAGQFAAARHRRNPWKLCWKPDGADCGAELGTRTYRGHAAVRQVTQPRRYRNHRFYAFRREEATWLDTGARVKLCDIARSLVCLPVASPLRLLLLRRTRRASTKRATPPPSPGFRSAPAAGSSTSPPISTRRSQAAGPPALCA